jgi:uncharacterized membrane protein
VLGVLAIVGGAIVGAVFAEAFGAIAGAALVWLTLRSQQQAKTIASLQRALDALALRPAPSASDAAGPVGMAPEPALPVPAGRAAAAGAAPLGAPAVRGVAADLARSASVRPQVDAPSVPRGSGDDTLGSAAARGGVTSASTNPPSLPGRIRQWLFGGNTIVKLGVGILFVGLAFLAKYASEHVQVPIELRLAAIAAAAIVLLGVGWRLRAHRAGYAQVLQGGAVAILYLTLFVAFRVYGVLALTPVFGCMVAVAALAAALAVLQDARALAVIGALGGFATPLLVSTGAGNHVALFSYYLVLDLGIALVAWHRNWRLLNLIGFFGTFLVGTAWGVLKYHDEHYASSQAFLIAYFLVFSAILLMPARQARPLQSHRTGQPGDANPGSPNVTSRSDAWVDGSLLFGLPTIVFVLQHGLVRHTDYGTALSALVLALFYVGLAAWMRTRAHLAVTFEASLAIATVFVTLVIPFALDAHSTAGAWALEGAGLAWLGLRQRRIAARLFGYLLLLFAGLALLYARQHLGAPQTVFNALLFNGLMVSAGSLAAAYFVARERAATHATGTALARHEGVAEPLLIGWGTLWLLVTAAQQVDALVPGRFFISAWLVAASAIALLCTLLAHRLAWRNVAWPVLGHAPLLALAVMADALLLANPSHDGGWWAWPAALAVHAVVLWRAAAHWPPSARSFVHTLGALVLAGLGALQGRAITADWGDAGSAWPWLGWLAVPAALLMLLPSAATAQRWPVRAAPAAYQTGAAAWLALGLLLWTLLANAASNGAARPLPHLPLLNPLDLGVGVALLAAALWARSDGARPLLAARPALPPAALGTAGFLWLNAILIRAFHHWGDVPYRLHAWIHSFAVQTGISLLWSGTALVLMWWSARRAARVPWLVGAMLLGAVVLKLLLVDLSGSGTVPRIVSFIGVGVLMLVIGYVAPIPAARDKGAPHADA